MNFDFSDDQKLLKEQVRKFLADKCPTKVVRRVLDGNETHADDVWKGLVDLGVPGIDIPEEYGGSGLSPLAVCVVAGESGPAVAPLPRAEGPQPPKPRNIRPLCGGGRLNGKKVPVTDGEAATFAIVLANTGGTGDRALSLVLVDLKQAAVAKKRVETIDPARKHAELTFKDAAAELLGGEGEGWRLLERLYDAAAVYFAFAKVGGAEAAMWMARDYALQRQAFGRAIGSYQAIKHKLADCYVKLELARSNAYYGAMMLTA